MIIGFAGRAGSGKSTACKILKELGYTEINFADPLKVMASQITDLPLEYFYDQEQKEMHRDIKYSKYAFTDLMQSHGFNQYVWAFTDYSLKFDTLRQLMQFMGDIFRQQDPDFWVKLATTKLDPTKNYVAGDCRFSNETKTIQNFGGSIVKIIRPGLATTDTHSSEQIDIEADFVIHNTDLQLFKRDILAVEGLINGATTGQKLR